MPGTEAIDAFTVNWGGVKNLWCPPLPRMLKHAKKNCATLIVQPNGHDFVVDQMMEGLFLPGTSGAILFNGPVPNRCFGN